MQPHHAPLSPQEQVDRLAELIQQRDQELAMLKGLTFRGPPTSPGGSPLSLTGRASVTPSESPGEAAAAAAGANNAAAAGAKVLFSLPGQGDG